MKIILFLFVSFIFLNASVNYSYTQTYDSFSCPTGYTYTYDRYADGTWYAPVDIHTSDFTDRGNNGSNFEIYCTLTSQGSTVNKFFCTQYFYTCVPQTCDDGAPTLTVTSTDASGNTITYNHCDRNCADIGYEIGTDGKCYDPQICTDAANSCSDTCGGEVVSFSCTNGQVTLPCVCKDKCEDYANQCTQECEQQGMFVESFSCTDSQITSPCQCGYWDNSSDNNSTNTDNTQTDNNSTVNDEDTTNNDTTNNNSTTNNTDTSTNTNNSTTNNTNLDGLSNDIAQAPAGSGTSTNSNSSNNIDLTETNNILNDIKDNLEKEATESSFDTTAYESYLTDLSNSFSNFRDSFDSTKQVIEGGFTFNFSVVSNQDGCVYSTQVFNKQINLDICTPFVPFKNFISLFVLLALTYKSIRIFIFALTR